MTTSKAARLSVLSVVLYFVSNLIVTITGAASTPWYESPFYTVGGSCLAVVGLVAGLYAVLRGWSQLVSNEKQFAFIGIVAGASYLGALVFARM